MHFDSSTNITFIYIIALVGTTKLGEEIIIVLIATDQSSNINQTLSKNEWIEDLSLGSVVNLPSLSKDSSNKLSREPTWMPSFLYKLHSHVLFLFAREK